MAPMKHKVFINQQHVVVPLYMVVYFHAIAMPTCNSHAKLKLLSGVK